MKSVFISHSSKDKAIADVIVYSLEQEGISVWIAPRDIPGGTDYGASIMRGLRESDVLVLVFSKASNESDAVIREVQLAFNEKKAIIPFRIEDTPVGDSLAFYLSGLHWIDAVQKKKRDLNVLLKDVKGVLQKLGREIKEKPPEPVNEQTPTPRPIPLPKPVPAHTPLPAPAPVPASASAPTPVPMAAPTPKPKPALAPVPRSTPTLKTSPLPSPVPKPIPKPIPTLINMPMPTPVQEPVHDNETVRFHKKPIWAKREIFAACVFLCVVIGTIAFFFARMNNDPLSHASMDDAIGSSFAPEIDDSASVFENPVITPIPEPTLTPTPTPEPEPTPEPTPTPYPEPTPIPAPTPTPATTHAQAQVRVGDIIQFGNYDWRVLDVQSNQALIITDRIISRRWYHHTVEAVTWETSDIRQLLNGEFFASFSPEEQARIAETYVVNHDNQWFNTNGGNNTMDRIFLLSLEEAVNYFGDSGQLRSRPSGAWGISDRYNNTRMALDLDGSAFWWWLRSPGDDPRHAADVNAVGGLALGGGGVFWSGGVGGGVRPALWLNLQS